MAMLILKIFAHHTWNPLGKSWLCHCCPQSFLFHMGPGASICFAILGPRPFLAKLAWEKHNMTIIFQILGGAGGQILKGDLSPQPPGLTPLLFQTILHFFICSTNYTSGHRSSSYNNSIGRPPLKPQDIRPPTQWWTTVDNSTFVSIRLVHSFFTSHHYFPSAVHARTQVTRVSSNPDALWTKS